MGLQELIETYGYLAILVITFIEGETIVILAGVAAHLGLLELQWVILSAIAGSFSGDQFWYYIGRHWGPKIIARRLSWQEGAQKVYKHLHRHQYWLILSFRFYYGFRNVTPFVVGSAHIPRLRFFTLNLIGAVVWAIIFAYVGYGLGEAASQLFIDDFKRYGLYLLGVLMLVGVAIWLVTLIRHRHLAIEHALKKARKAKTRRARS
ncbi:MAG: DedA family protein [Gammaproteobacteria bacterium]|nr:DedA family protein [Gammaproteobacteria bacterium]